jgi:hypothetical protein
MADYFIKIQSELADRNKLDTEIREWAESHINNVLVKDELSENFIPYLMQVVTQLNEKYPRIKKNLRLSINTNITGRMTIVFSDVLVYSAHKVKSIFSPF